MKSGFSQRLEDCLRRLLFGRSCTGRGMDIKLVVGLGNPETKYADTPHNVGFAVIDHLTEELNVRLRRSWRWRAMVAKTAWQGRQLWLVKPLSYMNNSGSVVRDIMRTAGIPPANLVVVLDDVDLALGQIRVRSAGGDAGHRGLRSVRECLGNDEFVRLRLGVGRDERSVGLVEYVLKKFPAALRPEAERMTVTAGSAVLCVLEKGVPAAMNEYNARRIGKAGGIEN